MRRLLVLVALAALAPRQRPLPAIGVAALDDAAPPGWCVAMPEGTPTFAPGRRLTIVSPAGLGERGEPVVQRVSVARARTGPCPTAFPQPRWDGYAFYDIAPADAPGRPLSLVALVVADTMAWTAGDDGWPRADLDGDGTPEEVRRCAAGEGVHFTLWSVGPGRAARRRAHEYFDVGVLVDETCGPGEDGLDPAELSGS
jgi:hypothetical protein